jgi:hypothetical protein
MPRSQLNRLLALGELLGTTRSLHRTEVLAPPAPFFVTAEHKENPAWGESGVSKPVRRVSRGREGVARRIAELIQGIHKGSA